MDRDEIAKVCNEEITKRFRDIGIFAETEEGVAVTRANFKLLDDIRQSREQRVGMYRRGFGAAVVQYGTQALWVLTVIAVTQFWPAIWKVLTK